MSEIAPELLHIELLDARGNPTGYARCDTGDGEFPGGLLAHNSGTATCEACINWEPDDDEPDDDEGPAPKTGAEGTATCGKEITLRAERAVLMADGTDGHGHPGGRETLAWRHTDVAIDYMHTAQLGGPA